MPTSVHGTGAQANQTSKSLPHGLSSPVGIRQQRNNIVPDDNKCYRESKQELGCPCMDCHGIFPNLLLVQLFGVQMEALIQV